MGNFIDYIIENTTGQFKKKTKRRQEEIQAKTTPVKSYKERRKRKAGKRLRSGKKYEKIAKEQGEEGRYRKTKRTDPRHALPRSVILQYSFVAQARSFTITRRVHITCGANIIRKHVRPKKKSYLKKDRNSLSTAVWPRTLQR